MRNKNNKKKAVNNPRGAPRKVDSQKKDTDGFTHLQKKQIREVAAELGVSIAEVKRTAWEWFYLSRENAGNINVINKKLEEAQLLDEEANRNNQSVL